jgi:Type III restriction enzyme, res subunit
MFGCLVEADHHRGKFGDRTAEKASPSIPQRGLIVSAQSVTLSF